MAMDSTPADWFNQNAPTGSGAQQERIPGVTGYYIPDADADRMGLPRGMWMPYGSEGPGGITGRNTVDPVTGVPTGYGGVIQPNGVGQPAPTNTGGITGYAAPGATVPTLPTGGTGITPGGAIDQIYQAGFDPNSPLYNPAQGRPSGGGLQGQAAFDAFGRGWTSSGGRTVADLQNYANQWNAQHPDARVTLGGSKGDKVYGPGGEFWSDAVIAAGEGGRGASWGQYGGGGGSQSGGGGGTLAGLGNGSLLTPWTREFQAPSAQDALNSPGLQFAMQEAQQALEKSAASRGTLLTGGTLKDLTRQQTGMALQGYGDVYNRAAGEYAMARDNFYNNQDRPYNKLFNLSQLGMNAANMTGGYGTQYGRQGADAYYGIGNAQSAGSMNQGNIWGGLFGGGSNNGGR